MSKIIIGTRKSALALWQTHHIEALLKTAYPTLSTDIITFTTRGDVILDKALPAIGGKGIFTETLENALRAGEIDYAVHSLKDMPTDESAGLTIGAITQRASAHDVLISKGNLTLDQLPHGATIGTSSRRRAAQLCAYRPDFVCIDIRGNVNTRIEKALAPDSPYHAIVLAEAGIDRLGLLGMVAQTISFDIMLPAPGQGALAVQCKNDAHHLAQLRPIADSHTTLCVTAERLFLSALGGGCSLPVGAYATIPPQGAMLSLRGRVCALDGGHVIDVVGECRADMADVTRLAHELAQQAISNGAKRLVST